MIATLLIAGSTLFLAVLASALIWAPSLVEEVAAALVGVPLPSAETERLGD